MTKEKLYTKPTEEEYEEIKDLNKTNKKILTYSILAIIIILATIMHFTTIVNIISSTINFICDIFKYIFIENINVVKQLSFVTLILLTNALLLIHVKTLKHVTFKRHRPNYLKKYSNTKFWSRVYLVITIPLLYLVYGSFTQFLTLILIVGIPISIYTYKKVINVEKLYPKLPIKTKEIELKNIEYLKTIKKKLTKNFGSVKYLKTLSIKTQINELNIVLNFYKYILDYNKQNEYNDISQKIEDYIIESSRPNVVYNLIMNSDFNFSQYTKVRNDIDFNKLKEILKENNIPIINYIKFTLPNLKEKEIKYDRLIIKLKNNIFY